MYKCVPLETGLSIEFSASFEGIDSVCMDVKEFIKKQMLEEYSFDIILCVREALSNAVRHGSKMDPSKKILFLLEADSEQVLIRVTDSGQGFDWQSAENKQASPTSTHGRGIDILKLYFDSHRYNAAGNEIELVKKIKKRR